MHDDPCVLGDKFEERRSSALLFACAADLSAVCAHQDGRSGGICRRIRRGSSQRRRHCADGEKIAAHFGNGTSGCCIGNACGGVLCGPGRYVPRTACDSARQCGGWLWLRSAPHLERRTAKSAGASAFRHGA